MKKEQIKQLVYKNLVTKRIILFGAGQVAEEFYMRNKDRLHISHCVSNLPEEWGQKKFLGQLDVREFQMEEILDEDYLIVCGPYAFRRIEIQLLNCGFCMFEHFTESSIAESLMTNKKIALFRGSCILRDIYECIVKSETFMNEYTAIYATDNYVASKYDNRVLYYASKICDCYIYSYRILRQDKVYLFDDDDLPADCKKISVSNITFPGYWPQADPEIRNSNKYLIHPYTMKRDLTFYHTLYRMEDVNVNRMIEEGKGVEEILHSVSALDYYTEKEVNRNLKVAFKSLQIAERFADITVMDYIKDNYNQKLVFQNFSHMHKSVIWTYVRRLLEKMDIDIKECDLLEKQSPEYIHHGGDIPVYPSVAKVLGLNWIDASTQYEVMTYHGVEKMTFEQYIRHYVTYTEKVREIMKVW